MKTINVNIYPKGGHKFKERDGSTHVSSTWAGVIALVIAYRKRAGFEPGNPREEVVNQACQNNPILCSEDNGVTQHQLKVASLKTRTLRWLNSLRGKPQPMVEEGLARYRAGVCAACPKNTGLQEGCSSCRAAMKGLREEIIGKKFVDGRLNSCIILGEDLPTAVHLDHVTHEFSELPEHCWRKRKI
jgi:hypothetical protein